MGVGELETARLALILRKVSEKLPLRKDSRAMTQEGGLGSLPGRVITLDMM